MRVIAGKYGGRKLVAFDRDHIRPTTDRVKESLFNILAPSIPHARVLDLFAGTGNLGIEALSRDAASVDFVEMHPESLRLIRQNLDLLKITESAYIHRADAVRFVEKYQGGPFQIILIDPPFPLKICGTILEALDKNPQVTDKDSIIAIEHQVHEPVPDSMTGLLKVDSRSYGDKLLAFYRRRGDA